jgi:hypothetical protein
VSNRCSVSLGETISNTTTQTQVNNIITEPLNPLSEGLVFILSPITNLVEDLVSLGAFLWFLEYFERNSRREHLTRSFDPLLQFPSPSLPWGHLDWL